MIYFMIDDTQTETLERAAKRLYTETRMTGDEMRDMAHALTLIVRVVRELQVPQAGWS